MLNHPDARRGTYIFRAACFGLLLGQPFAAGAAPPAGYRPPIISKVQIVYSMVSHHLDNPDRIAFYDGYGVPRGALNYAVPMLVYEPLVTLYNPYHDTLTIDSGVRVRIWDAPVGFRFKKNDVYLRPAFAEGDYQGLSFFNISQQNSGTKPKTFTLHLTDGTPSAAGPNLSLPPGGTATYALRLEETWTWGHEIKVPYQPHAVFDWSPSLDITNIDYRTKNPGGVEAIRGWDARAGFRTDHLSLSSARPPGTVYDFEAGKFFGSAGWVATLLTDTVTVEAAPVRTTENAGAADFQVDLMHGIPGTAGDDVLQELKFDLASLVAHADPGGATAAPIQREFVVGDLLQAPPDRSAGGKKIFAVLTAAAKVTSLVDDSLTRLGPLDATAGYDLRFDKAADPAEASAIGNLSPLPDELKVIALKRNGETLSVDLLSPLEVEDTWQPWGGESPESIDRPLQFKTTFVAGPDGTALRRATIELGEAPDRYFVQFRAAAPGTIVTAATVASTWGEAPRVTVKVMSTLGVATGAVVVSGPGVAVTGNLIAGDKAAVCTVALPASLPVGKHRLTANYAGDGIYSGSASTTDLVVIKRKSAIEVIKVTKSTSERPGKLRVTVTSPLATQPGGEVTVLLTKEKRRKKLVGKLTKGSVVLEIPPLPKGRWRAVATYAGDDRYAGVTSKAVEMNVKK